MRLRIEVLSSGVVPCVDIEDKDEASSSPPTPSKVEVELLFFRGNGARTLPGNSVRRRL